MKQICKIDKAIIDNIDFLQKVFKAKKTEDFKKLILGASPEEIRVITEIALNIKVGNFKISKKSIQRLGQFAEEIRKLTKTRTSNSAKKVIQKGGASFIPLLLAPVISEIVRHYL